MLNIVDCVQGDSVWFKNRLGCVTSSRVAAVVAKRKPKKGQDPSEVEELACRRDLRWELVCELFSGKPAEHYVSEWMERGKEREPLARAEYELRFDVSVEQVGFAYHPTIKMAGCSPDGVIDTTGLVEFKCPSMSTHLQYMLDDKIPDEYLPQLLWQLAHDPEREYNDFVSYHPDVPEWCQIFRKRLVRTPQVNETIRLMEMEVEKFNAEVERDFERLKQLRVSVFRDDLTPILEQSLKEVRA